MRERHLINRRNFAHVTGLGVATVALSPGFAFAGESFATRKVRIGIIGGNFGAGFFFHEHPDCIVEAVSDLITERRENLMKVYQCSKSYESLEKLIKDELEKAVGI